MVTEIIWARIVMTEIRTIMGTRMVTMIMWTRRVKTTMWTRMMVSIMWTRKIKMITVRGMSSKIR